MSLKTVQLVKFFLRVYFSKLLRSRNIRLSLSFGFKRRSKTIHKQNSYMYMTRIYLLLLLLLSLLLLVVVVVVVVVLLLLLLLLLSPATPYCISLLW